MIVKENIQNFNRDGDIKKSLKIGHIDIENLKKRYNKIEDLVHHTKFLKFQKGFGKDILNIIPDRFRLNRGWGNIQNSFEDLSRDELINFIDIIDKYSKLMLNENS